MLSRTTNFLGGVWVVLLVAILLRLPTADPPLDAEAERQTLYLAIVSLFYPIYYMAVSWAVSITRWREGRSAGA